MGSGPEAIPGVMAAPILRKTKGGRACLDLVLAALVSFVLAGFSPVRPS